MPPLVGQIWCCLLLDAQHSGCRHAVQSVTDEQPLWDGADRETRSKAAAHVQAVVSQQISLQNARRPKT
jgi:hypothetical protein